jgi:hypothetical protein
VGKLSKSFCTKRVAQLISQVIEEQLYKPLLPVLAENLKKDLAAHWWLRVASFVHRCSGCAVTQQKNSSQARHQVTSRAQGENEIVQTESRFGS